MTLSGCRVGVILTGVVCAWASGLGDAQNASPAQVIKNRVTHFHQIGDAFKGIRDQLRTSDPAVPAVQEFARRIECLGAQIPTWFPPGTGAAAQREDRHSVSSGLSSGDSGKDDHKTRAKDEIWTQRSAFEEAHKRFLAEAQKMSQVAKSGDKAALATQYKVLGQACKNCHNTFRE